MCDRNAVVGFFAFWCATSFINLVESDMSAVVLASYQDQQIAFTEDGWFNATQAAAKYGKAPAEWLRLPSTQEYLEALKRHNPSMGKSHRSKAGPTANGGGTWLHPKLAVQFARWLDVDFAVWCDDQIDGLLRGKQDWRKLRHEAASSFKVMQQILQMSRADEGKACAPHHYSNEARLVNYALTGAFKGLDRDALSTDDLNLLARLEERNTILIGRGLPYDKRKILLEQFAFDARMARMGLLQAA
jgi:KilA-N domain